MAIQMRKGSKDDFDPTKMLPGEWAVSIDSDTSKQMVWMCFRAGVVKRMGTYEDFKEQIRDTEVCRVRVPSSGHGPVQKAGHLYLHQDMGQDQQWL